MRLHPVLTGKSNVLRLRQKMQPCITMHSSFNHGKLNNYVQEICAQQSSGHLSYAMSLRIISMEIFV